MTITITMMMTITENYQQVIGDTTSSRRARTIGAACARLRPRLECKLNELI
jgi:hypothetical protein